MSFGAARRKLGIVGVYRPIGRQQARAARDGLSHQLVAPLGVRQQRVMARADDALHSRAAQRVQHVLFQGGGQKQFAQRSPVPVHVNDRAVVAPAFGHVLRRNT